MSKIRLGIIGAGQIGARHLQGLALFTRPAHIYVIDPSLSSLKNAQALFFRNGQNSAGHQVDYLQKLEDAPSQFDVVIVATPAHVRCAVVEELLCYKNIRFLILEKFLFQKHKDYTLIGELLQKKDVPTWVNCPLRTMSFFKQLKQKIQEGGAIDYSVEGSRIGLATNSIHHLDLASYLSNQHKWQFDSSLLDGNVLPSKRKGFIEFSGTLSGRNAWGSRWNCTSYPMGQMPLLVRISTQKMRCLIDLKAKKAWLSEEKTEWVWTETSFSIPLQSEMTHLVVEQILDKGFSDLPTYSESCRLHLSLLHAFLSHLRKVKGCDETCPIT